MNELPNIEQRVEKGRVWLEEQGAYDWAEKIVAAADDAKFDIKDCDLCAVGVTLGSEGWDLLEDVHAPRTEHVGFDTFDPPVHLTAVARVAQMDRDYAALEVEWLRQAREHAAYRAEVLG